MNFTSKIETNQEVTELENEIIKKYWDFQETEFINKPSLLKREYSISQYELNKLIREKSSFILNKGECVGCGVELVYNVKSQTQLREKINANIIHCEECREESQKKLREERIQTKTLFRNQNLLKALEHRLWEKLTTEEFDVLKDIVKLKERDAIFKYVFSKDYQGTWTKVNKLERLGLIDVLRGDNNSIISFDFLEELEVEILNFDEIIEHQPVLRNNLSFSLAQKLTKTRSTQPDYSGVFILPTDVLLKKGVEYIYGGWVQSDGTINLKFTPKDEVFPTTQKDIEAEPEHIKDIISKMNNDLSFFDENNAFDYDENDETPY